MGKIFSDQCHLSIKKSGMSIVYIEGSDAIISKTILFLQTWQTLMKCRIMNHAAFHLLLHYLPRFPVHNGLMAEEIHMVVYFLTFVICPLRSQECPLYILKGQML